MSPFHRAPKRSSPSAEDLTLPHGTAWPPSSLLHCRSSPDGAPLWAPLLSVFTIKTRARTTQSRTRPAHDTPCQVVPKPGQSRAFARESRRWQATSERPEPSGSGRSTEVAHPSPVAAFAEARPSPASGARPRKNDARCARSCSLRRAPATACCKDNGHSLSFSGWRAPAETRATQQPKPWRPEPSRPNTGETRDDCSSREHL